MDARQARTLTDIAKRGPPSGDFFSSGCRTAGHFTSYICRACRI